MTLFARLAPLFLYVITAECNLNPFYILGLPNKVLSPLITYTYGEPHQESWPHNIFDPSNYQETRNPQDYSTRYESNPFLMNQFDKTNPTAILNVNTNERVPYYNGESFKFPSNVYFPGNHVFSNQEVNGLNKNDFQGDWKKTQEIFLSLAESAKANKPDETEPLADYDLGKEEISTQHKTEDYKKLSLKTNQNSIERDVLPVTPNGNIMLVPLTNANRHTSQNIQIIGNDISNGLPIVNINGLLYYLANSPNTNVSPTERPGQVLPIDQFNPRNVPSLVLENGMNSATSGNNIPTVAPNQRKAKIVYALWPMNGNMPQSSGDQRSAVQDNLTVPKTNLPVPITNVPHLKVNDEVNKELTRNNINDLLLAYILQNVGRQPSDTIKDAQPSVDDSKSLNTDAKSININDLLALINSIKVHDTGKNDAIKNPLLVLNNDVPNVAVKKPVDLNAVNDEKVKILGRMNDIEVKKEHGGMTEGKEHNDKTDNKVTSEIVEDDSESLNLVAMKEVLTPALDLKTNKSSNDEKYVLKVEV